MKNAVLFLTFLTGFSGLVFQVVWQKYFSFFLGGEALSSALVVSVFLAGLSGGYYIFGKMADGKTAGGLLETAGLAEIGIGVWVFVFPTLFDFCWANMNLLPAQGAFRWAADLTVVILLMAPATILMGSTLPLLTSGLSLQKEELSEVHSRVYGINTLGAFLGSLAAGFLLIKVLGLPVSLMALSAVNIVAGLTIKIYGARLRKSEVALAKADEAAEFGFPKAVLLLAFMAGFVSIGFEIIFMRSLSLAIGTSEYSYSIVVAVFVLMIGLGSISLKNSKTTGLNGLFKNQVYLVLGLILVYLSIPYWGWLNYLLRHLFASTPLNFALYHLAVLVVFAGIIAMPVFFMGRCMPMLFSVLDSTMARAAENVGKLYAINTFGCGLGGLFLGYFLLLQFNADIVFKTGIFLAVLTLLPVMFQLKFRRKKLFAIAIVSMGAYGLPGWRQDFMAAGLYRERAFFKEALQSPADLFSVVNKNLKFLAYRDDPNTNVAVADDGVGRSLLVNGKSDGSSNIADLRTTLMLGHLPGLFANANGKAAVVGLGLGTSAEVIARYSSVSHVDVFEITQAVVDVQPLFESVNKGILTNPKVSILHMDAFRGLLSATDRYAIIISEPSNPWVSGVDRLFTEEFYQRVKGKMLPGGVFAQWMHAYEMSFETFGIVISTFSHSFPHQRIFSFGGDLIILGSETAFDENQWLRAKERWISEKAGPDMLSIGVATSDDLVFYEQFFPMEFADSFRQNSLFYPVLSYAAAKDFFMGKDFQISDVSLVNPLFAFSFRKTWRNSLMSYSVASNGFVNRVMASCVPGSNFAYEKLGAACKSKFLWLAASGAFNIPAGKPELAESARVIRELAAGKNPETKLNAETKLELLELYPRAMASPPLEFLTSIEPQCAGSEKCKKALSGIFLKFGFFEEAKELFVDAEFVKLGLEFSGELQKPHSKIRE